MRALIDILTGYEGAVQEANDDSSDENIAALELARAELLQVLLIAKAWEETNNLLLQNLPNSGTSTMPPTCHKHLEQMVLYFYDRPGGPQGNTWNCQSCVRERQTSPDATGFSL
jgi:hypothetical protein